MKWRGCGFLRETSSPSPRQPGGGGEACMCLCGQKEQVEVGEVGGPSLCSLQLLAINNKPSERVWRQAVDTKVFQGSWVDPVRKE